MAVAWRIGGAAVLANLLAGCAVGGFGAIGPLASAPPPPPPGPPPVSYGSFLEGPIGQKLAQADRDKALTAEQDAVVSGQRKTWRGSNGVFGYVEPAPAGPSPAPAADGSLPPADAGCRAFTSTVYLSGRPQVGHGRGCPNQDGTVRIVG